MASLFNVVLLLTFLSFATQAIALREFDRRSDLRDPTPPSELGWTVPLAGAENCVTSRECYDTLSRPATDKALTALAIGHGIFNYTCDGLAPANPPTYVSQFTELYDARALAATLADEQQFHDLIPKLYGFDLADLDNSTLSCMGSIGTLEGTAVVTLYDMATFRVTPSETIKSPSNSSFNGLWSRSVSPDQSWEVYRVEMAGGAVPSICADQPGGALNAEYVAEYWIYH